MNLVRGSCHFLWVEIVSFLFIDFFYQPLFFKIRVLGLTTDIAIFLNFYKASQYLPPATKLRQGNVFTPVCQSFCSQGGSASGPGGVSATPPGQTPPLGPEADTALDRHLPAQCMLGYTPPAQCMLGYSPLHSACWDMVSKQAVCIPLECILVQIIFTYMQMKLVGWPWRAPCSRINLFRIVSSGRSRISQRGRQTIIWHNFCLLEGTLRWTSFWFWPPNIISKRRRVPRFHVWRGQWPWRVGGGLYGVVQCIMGNDHMGSPMYRQPWLKTLPSRNFVGVRSWPENSCQTIYYKKRLNCTIQFWLFENINKTWMKSLT